MIPVKVLAVRYIPNADPALCQSLGAPKGYPALGLLTTDCDDATYIALDEATKAADVLVSYSRSFYAGAANASTPHAGEVIGILAGPTPGAVRSGMEAALSVLERLGFDKYFDFIMSCESVGSGKHRPDAYFVAAEKLGAAPAEIAVSIAAQMVQVRAAKK